MRAAVSMPTVVPAKLAHCVFQNRLVPGRLNLDSATTRPILSGNRHITGMAPAGAEVLSARSWVPPLTQHRSHDRVALN